MTTVRGKIIASSVDLNVKIDVAEANPCDDDQGIALVGTKLLIYIDHDPVGQLTPGEAEDAFDCLQGQDGNDVTLTGATPGDNALALSECPNL